ncbi:hypothetical protein BT63DRAFT_390621 [Microthyrium microscopicum]|uniref:Eukaryotic translation initiation factor 5B n=1 Tax=Microthyrium microscopicum TaxID=703497 RepID=A0A6A6U892_9PEZI|nr:hypothetical protein BT63DRAFT_390621 [Microthyrium microscopicum]
MAPKKKGSKKAQQDNWEEDLGETVDPVAQAVQAAKDEEAAKDAADEDDGGGLLAALRKNRQRKQKKGKVVEDFVEGEDAPQENGNAAPAEDLSAKAPQEATMDDEDVFGQPMKKGKGAKGKAPEPKDEDDEEEEETGGRVKSKKEKEKERKEREKLRKKEQASKKKTIAPAKTETPKPAEVVKPVEEPKAEAPAAAGGKKKKVPAALAAIQKQQEELRKKQEEEARLVAEEKAREEEAAKLEAEEVKRREEAKAVRKLKEKQKIEQQKKEGTFRTKAQREADARAQLRLQQMLEAGVAKIGGAEANEKKKPTYDKRKKGNKKAEEDQKAKEEAEAEAARKKLEELKLAEEEAANAEAEKARLAAEAKKAEESDELEDWEALADAEGVKDSWDAPSDEEKEDTKAITDVKASVKSKTSANDDESSDEEEDSEDESDTESESEEELTVAQQQAAAKKAEAAERRKKQHEEAMAARSKDNLRSPICCILGHVDTGKTKLLDKIRQTNVQEGEAGGITQQIGATYFPVDALRKKTQVVNTDGAFEFKVPGLLVIDTPGHESFSNLRSRGSSLCNIAILVVDIMHGLEPQTLESMKLLRDRKTPFIVALNKIDRLFGWKKIDNNGFRESFAMQNKGCQNEFKDRLDKTKVAFAEQGFNAELYFENKNMAKYVSLVPTSAHTGEGIPDLLKLLVGLSQERMTGSLMYLSEVQATVLEVKVIEGLGTTIDVILSNGVLKEGDRIVLCGINGPISTNIRALLTPAEMKELRIKSAYVHNKEVKAAMGVKIAADGLDSAVAGSRLLVVGKDDDEEDLEDEVMSDLEALLSRVTKSRRGVSVMASTLGSLEALLEFLKTSKIPVGNVNIGTVFKRDIVQTATMLEKAPEYAVMLCFDVKVDKDAAAYAQDNGIKIFTADIIYHLFDAFTKHMDELAQQRKEESKMLAVFPCVLKTVAVFNKKDPIILGVDVVEGNLRLLTPIAAVKQGPNGKEVIQLGRVQSIERDHKQLSICKKGQPSVAIKIEGSHQPLYGRQLEETDTLYSLVDRRSIDTLKEFYRADVSNDEWNLIRKLKPLFGVD